jgi:hypothetical protein
MPQSPGAEKVCSRISSGSPIGIVSKLIMHPFPGNHADM